MSQVLNGNEVPRIEFLVKSRADALILASSEKKSKRNLVIVLLMLDGGLRVTEVCRLKLGNFNFARKEIVLNSLKKRESSKNKTRIIPLTSRLINALSEYWLELKSKKSEDYLFPSSSKTGHLGRNAIWKIIKKIDANANPHQLRHTFATTLKAKGTDIYTIKELLGHSSITTTEIYTHLENQELRSAIETLEPKRRFSFIRKIFKSEKANNYLLHVERGRNKFIIGRKDELNKIAELSMKGVNILITGKQGTGKTQILENINLAGRKIIRVDEMNGKKALAGILLEMFNGDKAQIQNLLFQDADVQKRLNAESVNGLIDLMLKVADEKEYSLLIDDYDKVTPKNVAIIEKLRNHYHFILAARKVPVSKATALTNFEQIELKELKRVDAVRLINILSKNDQHKIENFTHYTNHIWTETSGNPQFIAEMVDRFSKEAIITFENVNSYRHNSALREIDMSLFFIIGLSCLMILRYLGRETGETSMQFIGAVFMIFALFARYLVKFSARKYI